MKKIVVGICIVMTAVLVSSCSLFPKKEVEDAMKLEGMMPKEDNKTIDGMMKKTEDSMVQDDAMMKKDDAMMKKDDAMIKKTEDTMMKKDVMETSGSYTTYSPSAVADALAAKKNVVLFFHATWCPSCKSANANFMKETAPANTAVFKVDYDTNKDLRVKYGVTSQHTFVSLNADESMKKKVSGLSSFADFSELN